ncbi:MAG: DUF1049 domain-containing protein [Magnetococcales bacterium]|nr:DUF1049 domain-containing protein [Magnetococcales bacterium]
MILAILLLIFTSQNMHVITVRFVFGSPVEMPMILALLGAFVAGFAVSTFSHIVRVSGKKSGEHEFE